MLVDTPVCDFGWVAPEFTLKNVDGDSFTMSSYLGSKGLLIAFICNHCPYVKTIATNFAKETKLLMDEGINVLAIMSNDYEKYPDDAPKKMKEFASTHRFEFPYLVDEDQIVAKQYGAVCTPDFFGFNSKGELQYRGRFDNIGMGSENKTRIPELVDAMREIAKTQKGPQDQTPSMGCNIKWKE